MASEKTLRAREHLIQVLSSVLFGEGYDDSIDRARSMARDETIWAGPPKKRRRSLEKRLTNPDPPHE